ncbi:MAG: hypothetical protein QOH79_1617 [Acidimicrobiaceae bacterium]
MTTRIGFLRAVNVGKRTVKMAHLVEVVERLGYDGVWTHINSGNVVFDATGSRDALEHTLEQAFESAFGFEVTTFVRTPAELRRAVALEPFDVASGDTYFLTFLKSSPTAARARALEALTNRFDTLVVQGRDVHWRMRGKSTDTKLGTKDWESLVGRHRSTSRNMTMLRKLVDKLD